MKLNKISSWKNFETIESKIPNDAIRSWLLESGPITKRIKQKGTFRLHLIQDKFSSIKQDDKDFIECTSNEIKLREVLLYCDDSPIVFAQTIIPAETISRGLKQLGNLGSKPLGDILFEKDVFTKDKVLYALFEKNSRFYWGRKAKYMVRGYKFSVMEVFLIDAKDG
jgi:chorismate--pyruvate lyase